MIAALGSACYAGVDERGSPPPDLADADDDDGPGPRPDPPHDETTGGKDVEGSSSSDDGFELTDLGLPPATTRLVDGVELVRIEITQGVAADIGHAGEAVLLDATVDPAFVRDRPTLFRAHYVNAGSEGRAVDATLHLLVDDDHTRYTTPVSLAAIGVVEWLVPGTEIQPSLEYAVELEVDVDVPVEYPLGAARTPADGFGELYVRSSPTALSVHVVPVRHQYAGCDQTPVPDEAWWDALEDHLWMQYPIAELEVVRGEPWAYGAAMTDFSLFLADLSAYRVAAGIEQHVYVYGLVLPCDGGEAGVGGRGWLSDPDAMDGYYRTSMGRWYPDFPPYSIGTIVHEVGHNHGRQHVACNGEGDPDPNYPVAGGYIGREGWGQIDGLFRDTAHVDFMTYCDPAWVSAYGWNLAFHRAAIVTEHADGDAPARRPVLVATEDDGGRMRWQTISARLPARQATARLDLRRDGRVVRSVDAVVTVEAETGRRSYAALLPDGLAVDDVRIADR